MIFGGTIHGGSPREDRDYRGRAARFALYLVGIRGVVADRAIGWGLQDKVFSQSDVDATDRQCRERDVREAHDYFVKNVGVDCALIRQKLVYGVEHGLLTPRQVDAIKKRYETIRYVKALFGMPAELPPEQFSL